MSKKQTFIDIVTLQKLIKERRLTANYDHFDDKIAVCRDRIETWKFIKDHVSKLIYELCGAYAITIEQITISPDSILTVAYETGYGTNYQLVCDAAYLFLSIEEAKKDWNDFWDNIKKARDERDQEKERAERYQKFLELKQEFEPNK